MKPHSKSGFPGSSRKGFTLIEILTVLVIIGIVIAIAFPTLGPFMRSSRVNRSGTMIVDELNQARQFALTKNRDVEVRFYQLPRQSGSGAQQYRAFRTFYNNAADPTQSKPLGKLKYLPEPTIISDKTAFSTMLDYNNSTRSGLAHNQETFTAPAVGSVPYVSFLFRANGGTTLAPVTGTGSNWFLTLYLEDDAVDTATQLPKNYYNVQVDPVTGRVRSYRP